MGLAVVTTPWTQPGRGVFSISVAAELTGLHPQTLRIYEREGLLDPARSPGGTRRYSTDDIDRLHQIMALTADGLNLAGVRRVLELQAETQRLQAEINQLKAAASEAGSSLAVTGPPPGQLPPAGPAAPGGEEGT
jgi:MerR family transcriptional regulator, heat shock protein HspR